MVLETVAVPDAELVAVEVPDCRLVRVDDPVAELVEVDDPVAEPVAAAELVAVAVADCMVVREGEPLEDCVDEGVPLGDCVAEFELLGVALPVGELDGVGEGVRLVVCAPDCVGLGVGAPEVDGVGVCVLDVVGLGDCVADRVELGVRDAVGVIEGDGTHRTSVASVHTTLEKVALTVAEGFCLMHTVQPRVVLGTVRLAASEASSDAKLAPPGTSTTLAQLVAMETSAARSPVPTSPVKCRRTALPVTIEPDALKSCGAAADEPAASVVAGELTKDRSLGALNMNQRAADAASGAAATGYAAKPALRNGVGV